ncbi:Non-homologous end joining protein Ku [Ralstonia condita]|jgi:DNA end-binding protein Ku|uniref:Non-homologous end joining protein Ku n=1 Tax=Ralstonia condita TaxID=3058600 RepID=A0ABN9J0C7_9RALS|nr:Ku protein [Ralstonia sp. LMG 7141]MDE2201749.1 Ku protein [Burkholderiaceae bacterium]CAJ0795391.1 Non-homologous end joining protein Ku [Ralstonia sp. LMG 7141]
MPRVIWKGAVSFGLVHIPVALYPATRSDDLDFDWLDRRTMDRVGYKRVNKATGKEVPREQIVRGFAYEKDRYVILTDEDIRAANPASTQTVDLLTFVDAAEIPFLYLDTPYFLAPDRRGEKVYALLREAMARSRKIGVANVVLHTKQHLAALIPMGPVLVLHTLRWSSEVRDWSELDLPAEGAKAAKLTAREIGMAEKLVDDMSGTWNPAAYHDTFRDDILALVDRKVREGRTESVEPMETEHAAPRTDNVIDLTDLLRQSLARRGRGKGASTDDAAQEDAPAPRKRASRKTATSTARKTAARRRA